MAYVHPPIGREILALIDRAAQRWEAPTEAEFGDLALRLFAHQFAHNAPYRRYCEGQGRDPLSVGDWTAIPPVATDAFKVARLTTLPEGAEAAARFQTSGTTQGQQGAHILRDLSYYHRALEPAFTRYLLPEGAKMRFVNLTPAAADSSLGHMVRQLSARYGTAESSARMSDEKLDLDGAWEDLDAAAREGTPVVLLGTAFAFVFLLEHRPGARIKLPPGSRLMETGGFKGRTRAIPRGELRARLGDALGLKPPMIVGEYGMTELSSQLYEGRLRGALQGDAEPEGYLPPPWMRVRVVDPLTLAPRPIGEEGLILFMDLANVESVAAILTGDLGALTPEGGLLLRGRAEGADARGCSLRVEELMAAQDPGPGAASGR